MREAQGAMSELYPLFFDLEDLPCLVVGGGKVALRKVKGLKRAGARITVVAPNAVPELKEWGRQGKLCLKERPFEEADVEGQWLVFCAVDEEEVSRAVHQSCEKNGVPVNVADVPRLCRFQVPARYVEGRLQLAVSTKGGSPALARRLREEMEGSLSPWAPRLAGWLAELRPRLKGLMPGDAKARGDVLNRLVDSSFESLKDFAARNDRASFDALVEELLEKR